MFRDWLLTEAAEDIRRLKALETNHQWPGVPFALLSAILFGSVPFSKQLLSNIDPWLLAGLLYIGSGLGLSITGYLGQCWPGP
jgi:hypothetical protein